MTITPHAIEIAHSGHIEFSPKIFEGHENARFAVGILAIGDEVLPGLDDEFAGYALERARRYIEAGYITTADLNADGTELDKDDSRSVHIVAVQNFVDRARAAGTMRLVVKSSGDEMLPVEGLCPDAFPEPATSGSVEVSRLTALSGVLTRMLFANGVSYVGHQKLGPAYGLVTPGLRESLRAMHAVPVDELGQERFIRAINSSKLPIRVDVNGLTHNMMQGDQADVFAAMRSAHAAGFTYSGRMQRI